MSSKNAVLLDAAYDSNGVVVYDKEGNQAVTLGYDETMNAITDTLALRVH